MTGYPLFLEQAGSNITRPAFDPSAAVPFQASGSGAAGPDTITLDISQFYMVPLAFMASLDGRSLGQGTLAAATSFGYSPARRLTLTGDFSAGRELDLTFGGPITNAVSVVSGTLNGQQFLLGGAVSGSPGSIALFPHASSASVVVSTANPYA